MTNEEAIEILNKIMLTGDFTDEYGDMINTEPYEEAINLAIKALEERPHGKWIIHQNGLLLTSECNNCHCFIGTINMNFCPNCGADMREADNETL